ncbi:MAG: ATP-binding protein [Gammaproteobacteria bacterium]|nr:ATP-binding protein [Gammaproteobacteria bacterium]
MAIKRHLEERLLRAVNNFPVVTLTGPRQSGKTTLARMALPQHSYVSLEDPDERRLALDDPRGFLSRFKDKVIIDEAQHAPDLFSYIQGIVDQNQLAGQFVLTGSQNFLLLRRISQSLAGRCDVLHLLPFSHLELAQQALRPIEQAAERNLYSIDGRRENLFNTLFAGGYPRIYDKGLEPQEWLASYYQTYIERDVRELLQVGDIETFGRFMGLCGGRVGQLLNLSALANDCGITHTTAKRWLSVLEASFIVMLLRPHYKNFSKRLIKSPKLYFLDSGLLCYLLRIRSPDELILHASRGAIFESWVISEAAKNFIHRGLRPDIHFWRDSTGHEIDLLIENNGSLQPIEIKSGQTFSSEFVKNLDWWRQISCLTDTTGLVIYGGDTSIPYKNNRILSWNSWG